MKKGLRITPNEVDYFNMEKWQACEDNTLDIDQFIGRSCIQACDLARKADLNSKVRLFCKTIDGEKHWYCISPQFWIPHDAAFDNENKALGDRYQKYISLGALSVTDGGEIDYHAVLESILSSHSETFSMTVALDPNGASFLGRALMGHGVDVATVTQNYTNFSEPMIELENAINNGRFHHDGNPIMTWNISNVVGKRLSGNDNTVRPIKQKPSDNIDGAIALIMAIGEAMSQVRHSEPKENNIDKHQFTDANFKLIPSVFTDDEQIHLKLFASTGVLSKEDVRQMAIHYGLISNAEYQPPKHLPPPEPPKAPEPPPTTEYMKGTLEVTSDQVTFRALGWFGFCCFCLGLAVGSTIN